MKNSEINGIPIHTSGNRGTILNHGVSGLHIVVSAEGPGPAPTKDIRTALTTSIVLRDGDRTLATYGTYRDEDLPHAVAFHGPLTFPFTTYRLESPDAEVEAAIRTLASWAPVYVAMRRYEWARGSAQRAARDGEDTPLAIAQAAEDLTEAREAFFNLFYYRNDVDHAPADIAAFVAEDQLIDWQNAHTATAGEADLRAWAATRDLVENNRDHLISAALAAGVSKNTVHRLTGMSRVTINRIAAE
jgi:hypothetical protein